ncbi:hypothetical protein SE18_24545 [Herpetosiphon geysericola]|uniref:Phage head morphogenesis domain-containing protein n=2 Tax=Herpetosiphon geysericola TaxID=70996 RepID=A0A0P6XBU5_9CHLR|nr:hypothetical protein SE18_24545 [Herpetosiphon geysericola]
MERSSGGGMIPTYPMTFPGWTDMGADGANPPKLTPEARARLAMQSAWVFSNVQVIAQELTTATLRVSEALSNTEEPQQVINHAFELLWNTPNPFFSRSLLMQVWAWFLCLKGEAYLYFAPDASNGDLIEIWPLPAWACRPVPHPTNFIEKYALQLRPDAKPIYIDAAYICYSRLPNPFDLRRGLSPLEAASLALQTDDAQKRWNWRFFDKENAMPTNVVSLPQETSNTDFERFRAELFDFYGSGQRRTMVARGGQIDFKALAVSQREMDFITSRSFTRDEIDRAFGFPGGYWTANATEANQRGAKAVVIENAVWPKAVLLAEDLTTQIVRLWYGPTYRASFDDIRPRNIELDIRERQANESTWTVNELREAQGKAPLDDNPLWDTVPAKVALQSYTVKSAEPAEPEEQAEPVAREDSLEDTDEVEDQQEPEEAKAYKSRLLPYEEALAKALHPLFGAMTKQIVTAITAGETMNWDLLSLQLGTAMHPELVKHAISGIMALTEEFGIAIDLPQVTIGLNAWADSEVPQLLERILKPAKDLVEQVTRRYQVTPGMTRGQLETALSSLAAPYRVEMVTVNAITKSASRATLEYQSILAGFEIKTKRIWRTSNDDKVCRVCSPMNGKPEEDWKDRFPAGPGAHDFCRCFTTLKVVQE